MKPYLSGLLFFIITASLFARGNNDSSGDGGFLVTASTSWTAAIAIAAGADNVKVLSPAELRHPPEYELKPSDLAAASRSKLIVYAGWEIFAKRLSETAGSAGVPVLILETLNHPETLIKEARKIAAVIGTSDECEAWVLSFSAFTNNLKEQILPLYNDRRAVVHYDQIPFAQWLGFEIIGVYGPAEPSPSLIVELARLKPALVIDNYHAPAGLPIAEAAKAGYAELISFPGKNGSRTLEDVFAYNADILIGTEINFQNITAEIAEGTEF